ncbi:chromosome segregation protein SMC [Sporomusa aerivorans]|uniref:chromosome segregation protein SMC n=1 Tax=Sporomusa aerivorans TaxID=204936 RepID=UPI00352AA146
MLLRRLEAYGFKSFAEKTEVEFGRGITAIVGPNGSGKSNISDAIRWALGEQSLRTLRGTKMDDVIFAGSVNRRPLGVAEVSLVFDNSDGQLPIDFNEVTITRRVFRSGESEYSINRTPCRLKDIHDMLSDTGLGRESMTVIGQNKVDEILSSKPEERRLLFEEAAGIIKYKQRKRDALRKLEDTEQNLTRVQDITAELERQLGPLAESAARTAEFNRLNQELTTCQATLLLERLEKAEKLVESASLEQSHATDRSIAVNTRIVAVENEKDVLTINIAQAEEQIAGTDIRLQEATNEIEQADSRRGVLSERIEQGRKAEARFNDEVARLEADQQAAKQKVNELHKALADKQFQVAEAQEFITTKNDHNEQLLGNIGQIEQQIDSGKEQSFDHLQGIVNERNNLRMLERDLTAFAAKEASLAKEHNDYVMQHADLDTKQKLLINESEAVIVQQQELEQKIKDVRERSGKLASELKEVTNKEQQLANQLNETSARCNVLTSMQAELEGFSKAIKGILRHQSSWRAGVCGVVAQLLTVPDNYIHAIEVALGGAQQHIVTDTDQTAKQAIHFLKTHNMGRATFLPLNTIKVTRPREAEILAANQPGAIGFAADVIGVDERYRSVVNYLLGRVIIAKTVDDALRIARANGFSVKIVTLDGELINPGGSLTGGSMGRKENSFIARNNEINSLQGRLNDLKVRQSTLAQENRALARAMEESTSQIVTHEANHKDLEVRRVELAMLIDKVMADGARCEKAISTIQAESAECQNEACACQALIEKAKEIILSLESQELDHKSKVANWQSNLQELKTQQQTVGDDLTNAKIKLGAIQQELISIRLSCEQYEQTLSAVEAHLSRITCEVTKTRTEIGQAQNELTQLLERKENLLTDKHTLTEARQEYYAAKLTLLTEVQKYDKEMKELRRQHADLQAKLHELDLMITKYSYEAANCVEQITGQLAMSIEAARSLKRPESIDQLVKAVAKLEQQVTALGPVNPAAIDEYNRVQERYNFLQEQTSDLVQAKDYLTSVIHEVDLTMSRQFNTAFKAINQYFSDVFVRLFGGGKAELVLIEPGNVLGTGIDIIVQPPGKRLQNLALLSGGERALTVIALLFAILTYRPAPFCVVDEIDAALDEANVTRFSEFLRDYAKGTQFIVVTHRKGTMEAAGVLHGITMEESGISRLVSVKFMDKAG